MSFSVDSTLTGIHSRSEETVRVTRNFDRGRTTQDELEAVFESDAKNLVRLEIEAGMTMISEGQLRWQDFIRPFSESITGLKNGADLSRWYDTNSFYRKPSVVKQIRSPKDASFLVKYIESSALNLVTKKTLKRKISLPGPFTLASLVANEYYESEDDLLVVFTKMLSNLISKLPKIGFDVVQINEPSLVYRYHKLPASSRKIDHYLSTFSEHFSHPPIDVFLHTCFGDCSKILGKLLELEGMKGIGIDFTQTSLDSIDKFKFKEKVLCCGCVDGRNSLVEKPEWIAKFCQEVVKTLKPNGLVLLPSTELKYLPRSYADEKIRSIGTACDLLRSSVT